MQVIVPFVEIQPATKQALDASGWPWEGRYVGDSDSAYWELLKELWTPEHDLCIGEHDIVIGHDTLALLEACPEPWCAASYRFLGRDGYTGLGCVRFRAELIAKVPGLLDEVAEMSSGPLHPKRHWCSLDSFLQVRLRGHGFNVCVHPPVQHLHEWPSHGCLAKPVTAP